MKYYSETLDKLFNTEQELLKAEHQFEGEETHRRRTRVEETYHKYQEAQKQADKILDEAEKLAKPLYEQINKIYEEANSRMDEIISCPKRDWINAKESYYAQKPKESLDVLKVSDILSLFNTY